MEDSRVKITEIGKDLILVGEKELNEIANNITKVHLIKFNFEQPTKEKIMTTIEMYPQTNRFIIGDHIKFYNGILKSTNKKYYVQNKIHQDGIFSFFRKNNKILLSVPSLKKEERTFILTHAFEDVLRNLEIIMLERGDYETSADKFKFWKGNVVLFDKVQHANYL